MTSGAGILVRAASDVDASADADARIVDGLVRRPGHRRGGRDQRRRPDDRGPHRRRRDGPAIAIDARMAGDLVHTYGSMAHSGAGLTETDLAGAFAINVDFGTTEARTDGGASLTLVASGDLTVSATYATINTAGALSTVPADPMIGIGGSIAANTVLPTTRAALGSGAVTGAGAIDIESVGTPG